MPYLPLMSLDVTGGQQEVKIASHHDHPSTRCPQLTYHHTRLTTVPDHQHYIHHHSGPTSHIPITDITPAPSLHQMPSANLPSCKACLTTRSPPLYPSPLWSNQSHSYYRHHNSTIPPPDHHSGPTSHTPTTDITPAPCYMFEVLNG